MVINEAQLSMVQLYYEKECEMVTKFIITHMCLREGKKIKEMKIKEKEEDQDKVQEISDTQFMKQAQRREQVEGDRIGEKDHKDVGNMEGNKNPHQQPNDSP